jgi:hypothetical protein
MKPDLSCERWGCNALATQFIYIEYKFEPTHAEYCAWCVKHSYDLDINKVTNQRYATKVAWEQISEEEYMVAKILNS